MNVVLITTDQQRADSIGAYGNEICQTPNLDRLASEGTRFDACRTQNPYCQPSRATILTGQYPSTHGVVSNGMDMPFDTEERSIATLLGNAGYRTAIFGKAHFATVYPIFPTGRLESVEGSAQMDPDWRGPYFGFDHCELQLFGHMLRMAPIMGNWNWCYGPPPFGLHYAQWLFRDGVEAGSERLRQMQPEAAGRTWDRSQTWPNRLAEEDHATTWVADRAIDWITEAARGDDDFFAWVSFTDPHHPMDPPAPWCDLYDPADMPLPEIHPEEFDTKPPLHRMWSRGAAGEAGLAWANPGGANLKPRELATMIAGYYAMVSQLDNAIGRVLRALDDAGVADETLVIATTDHGDFLGDHQMVFKGPLHYEGLLRVPLILRGPGFEAGVTSSDPVGTIDLAPTMLEKAGITIPDWVEGRPLLDGPREWVLTENDHRMVFDISLRTLTTARYKITSYLGSPDQGELYDLDDDPGEFVNRWDDPSFSEVRSDLLATLDDVMNHDCRELPMVGVVG